MISAVCDSCRAEGAEQTKEYTVPTCSHTSQILDQFMIEPEGETTCHFCCKRAAVMIKIIGDLVCLLCMECRNSYNSGKYGLL